MIQDYNLQLQIYKCRIFSHEISLLIVSILISPLTQQSPLYPYLDTQLSRSPALCPHMAPSIPISYKTLDFGHRVTIL